MYFGSTSDLKRRFAEHQAGKCFTTSVKGINWTLLYYEAYKTEDGARKRESRVKNNGGTKYHLVRRIKGGCKDK